MFQKFNIYDGAQSTFKTRFHVTPISKSIV